MKKFKVGDKVRWKERGLVGTVVEVNSGIDRNLILCRFPGFPGHHAKEHSNHGPYPTSDHYFLHPCQLEPVKNETIVIYRNGQEVIALDKVSGKKASAKCSPEDAFDFTTGAKLAFSRLMDEEPKKYKRGDLFQIKPNLADFDENEDPCISLEMLKCAGKIFKFKGYSKRGNIILKKSDCYWLEKWLNPIKEVKRVAKPGEFVKIVNANLVPGNDYKNGDILKIIGLDYVCLPRYAEGKRDGVDRLLSSSEYVVLEGYEDCKYVKKFDVPLYNGKVVCVDNKRNLTKYTVGKIYQFTDGALTDDYGCKTPYNCNIHSFEEWEKFTSSKFIEVKE